MKFSTIVFVCACLFASTEAQFFGMPFGGFPIAGPGLFGRIFPPVIPHMRPGLFLRNGMAMFPFGGKRDLESQPELPATTKTTTKTTTEEFKALCAVSTLTSSIICNGVETWTNFECAIEPRGNATQFKLILADLVAERPVTRETVHSLSLFSRLSKGKFTYINPTTRSHVILDVFTAGVKTSSSQRQNGFFVKDVACFDKFVKVVRELPTEDIRISLFASP